MSADKICITCNNITTLFINPTGSSQVCSFTLLNCISYNSYGYCTTCRNGYVLILNNQYFCAPIPTNCDTLNATDNSKCLNCSSGYHIFNSLCYPNVEGCLVYSSQNLCVSCAPNYLLKNNTCFFKDINCIVQDINGYCLACINGFLPFKNKCVIFDPFCLSYFEDGTCNSASNQFNLSDYFYSSQLQSSMSLA
jgi:hypothetical protein